VEKKKAVSVVPPITVTADDMRRLNALADSNEELSLGVARFLAKKMERATEVEDSTPLQGIIRMGSRVRYYDDKTGEVRDVVLVYPHEADIAQKRISVLTPVGAALIGLSSGRSTEFSTPDNRSRSVTVLGVEN
jgi:regulator of nucleoside diphosphate kinase